MEFLRKSLSCSTFVVLLTLMACGSAHASSTPHFIYEVFTGSFNDSNGDGTGDLQGVRAKLNYISALGADAIWLTPIFNSPSYHGYDVSDYLTVKSVYGNLSDLQSLITDAHALGIKIILDVPVNHTSTQSAWFGQNDLYLWSSTPTFLPANWHKKNGSYYYSSFGANMPDLNWQNPDVLSKIETVFNYWTSVGVDGFRLDAAKYLIKGPNGEQNMPGTHTLWQQITANVKATAPQTYFIGEVWDAPDVIASYYGSGNELDAAFDFPVEGSLRSSITSGTSTDFVNALTTQLSTQKTANFAAPFAGSHDLDRLATTLNNDLSAQKLAALAVFALPGTPVVYYGDEIGMPAGNPSKYPGDLAKRTPMDWKTEAAEDKDPESLLNTYRTLAHLRAETPALSDGILSQVNAIGPGALSFVREGADVSTLVILNFGSTAVSTWPVFVASAIGSVSGAPTVLYGSLQAQWQGLSTLQISTLGPKQAVVIRFPTH